MVNELSFTIDKGILDEFFPIYLIWSASFVSFLQIFRFTAISRGYLLLYTFIVPLVLVLFRISRCKFVRLDYESVRALYALWSYEYILFFFFFV